MIKKFTKSILLICLGLFSQQNVFSQTTIYSENFNGSTSGWSLNTSDLGSGTNANSWIVNNVFLGGLFGLIPDTPNQPPGITGNPQSAYLHISSGIASINNANFLAPADGNVFAKMNASVSTIGFTGVNFKFWYLCDGDAIATDAYYGRTYYSIDGGNTWVQNPDEYSQISTWTQATITNPVFNNQADLRFAFMWVQNSANVGVASDPAFSVDDILIEGAGVTPATTVTTGAVSGSPFCGIKTFNLTYSSTGTFDSGNTFTVQLSDANGSFASPTTIGSGSASPIACVLPNGTASGSGYLVRVVASSPATTGSNSALSYFVTPTVSTSATATNCNGSPSGTVTASATGDAAVTGYSWSTTPVSTTATVSNLTSGTYYVTVTYGSGCTILDSAIVTSSGITLSSSVVIGQGSDTEPNGSVSIGVVGGTPPYSYLWNTTPVSTLNGAGELSAGTYTCIVTDASNCSVTFTFNVPYTVGINEMNKGNFEVYPNPVNDILFVKSNDIAIGNANITLFDLSGKVVLSENNIFRNKNIQQINISELPNGVYFLQYTRGNYRTNKKVIKL